MSDTVRPKLVQVDKIIGQKPQSIKFSLTDKKAILYALGIGFSQDPMNQKDMKFTNQTDSDFTVFPVAAVNAPLDGLMHFLALNPNMPDFNIFQVLHAEQKLVLVKQKIQTDKEYISEREIIDCCDKGKNAFVLYKTNSYCVNEKGERQLAFCGETLLFIKGLGGFNFQGKGFIKPIAEVPKRKPDWQLIGQTFPGQAFLYRLSFDINPLHIDPNISKIQNFQRPILHGLASYATIARVVIQQLLNNDPSRFKEINARFVGHVYPGQTLIISVWKQENRFYFQAIVKQRKTKALIGYIVQKPSAKL